MDRGNCRIQVFIEGVFQSKFGIKGSRKGQFEEPYDIAIDNFAEQIFVTDRKLDHVQVFNLQGDFISFYTNRGQLGPMKCPNCITNDVDSFVLITECSEDKQDLFPYLLHSSASLSLVLVIKEKTAVNSIGHLVLPLLRMVMSL